MNTFVKTIKANIAASLIRLTGRKIMVVKKIPVILFTGKAAERVLRYFRGCEYAAVYKGIIFPYIAYAPLKGAPFILGCIFHELGHIIYAPAQCTQGVSNKTAHDGKGARYEHQADKFAIRVLIQTTNGIREIRKFCNYLSEKAAGDGKYRAELIRRYVRRYYRKEL